jgi:hypothetical protein
MDDKFDEQGNKIGLIKISLQFNNDKIFQMYHPMCSDFGTAISKETFINNKNLLQSVMNQFIDLMIDNEAKK